jgi:hypothetical protein
MEADEIIKAVFIISKSRRFSNMSYLGKFKYSHTELCDLWKGLSKFVMEQMLLKKVFISHI